jgi:formylglycine-generating enzyme required for sulfatase activity
VGQFREFVEATGYRTDAELNNSGEIFSMEHFRWEKNAETSWKNPGWTVSDDQPVTMVSHNDAQAFVDWLAVRENLPYKLPTEAQWEYAARGDLPSALFPWGDSLPDETKANFADRNKEFPWKDPSADCGFVRVSPVGSFPANGFGLYDMAGNVMQWVRDFYQDDYYRNAPEVDPEGPGTGTRCVTKGGDWTGNYVSLRCAFRGSAEPEQAFYNVGFRVIIETANPQRLFDFRGDFLTRTWSPTPDDRYVGSARVRLYGAAAYPE